MHTDARTLPSGTVLEGDLCIVGAGASGITIAREFANSPLKVILLEGGGFEFECSYMNTSNEEIGFGESANDEMCFFWAYYYPSKGSKVCVHTEQVGGTNGLNVCCPGDPTLCDLIEDMF